GTARAGGGVAVAVVGQCPPPREHLRDTVAAATRARCSVRTAAVERGAHDRAVDRLCRRRRHCLVREPHPTAPVADVTGSDDQADRHHVFPDAADAVDLDLWVTRNLDVPDASPGMRKEWSE